MRKLLIAFLLIPSLSRASEGGDALKKSMDACMASDNIDICKTTKRSMKRMEKKLKRVLENYGMETTAIVMTSATKALVEKRIEIKTGSWKAINMNRSVIQINEEGVYLQLEWRL